MNMSREDFNAIHKSNDSFSVHRDKISWDKRIDQLLHDKYAGKYVDVQIRINLDDDYHPYWVVYLAHRHVVYDVLTMEKILIIDAMDMDRNWEYDVDSPDIPGWLEVVYPDMYLYDWAKLWGSWREGIGYKWFNKRHLSYPDDSPRFMVLNKTAYWYVPMKQLDSRVLAGFILMNTRTGEAKYYNREVESFADRYTAQTQVEKYLKSGIQGFRQLTIHEGYLYPIQMDTGGVREAYIFPLYSGFTIQQFAIVDAVRYTNEPFLSTSLEGALRDYQSYIFEGGDNISYDWSTIDILNAYVEDDEAAITYNCTGNCDDGSGSATNGSTVEVTTVITKKDLSGGSILDGDNEWRELKLAVSEFERTGNESLDVVLFNGKVIDVDYGKAHLIEH